MLLLSGGSCTIADWLFESCVPPYTRARRNVSRQSDSCALRQMSSASWPHGFQCAGPSGKLLQQAAAERTEALEPPQEYVPWVVVDGGVPDCILKSLHRGLMHGASSAPTITGAQCYQQTLPSLKRTLSFVSSQTIKMMF